MTSLVNGMMELWDSLADGVEETLPPLRQMSDMSCFTRGRPRPLPASMRNPHQHLPAPPAGRLPACPSNRPDSNLPRMRDTAPSRSSAAAALGGSSAARSPTALGAAGKDYRADACRSSEHARPVRRDLAYGQTVPYRGAGAAHELGRPRGEPSCGRPRGEPSSYGRPPEPSSSYGRQPESSGYGRQPMPKQATVLAAAPAPARAVAPASASGGGGGGGSTSGPLKCDKCDGPHPTDQCPWFRRPRERHPDAAPARHKKQLGGNAAGGTRRRASS